MNTHDVDASKTIVLVGAAGGIGLEILKQLRNRAKVLAVVQNAAQAEAAISAGASQCFECDLIDPQSTALALAAIERTIGGQLDGLIMCAGIQPAGAAEVIGRGELEKVFAVNVFSALQFVQGLLPGLRRRRGRIVFFSSMAGWLAAPMLGTYCASKFALEGLADVLRRELHAAAVTVSLIEPGAVVTAMATTQGALVEQGLAKLEPAARTLYERMYRGYLKMTAGVLPHASRPEDVAQVACRAVLGNGRPRPRYVVGTDAKIMRLLVKLLPIRWMDALLMKATAG